MLIQKFTELDKIEHNNFSLAYNSDISVCSWLPTFVTGRTVKKLTSRIYTRVYTPPIDLKITLLFSYMYIFSPKQSYTSQYTRQSMPHVSTWKLFIIEKITRTLERKIRTASRCEISNLYNLMIKL